MSELAEFVDKKSEDLRVINANITRFGKMAETMPRQFHKRYSAWLVLRQIDAGRKILDELEEKFKPIEAVAQTAVAAADVAAK